MTRIRLLMLTGLIAFWPGVAQAQWEWYDWLQELSGPGPFHGSRSFEFRIACFPHTSDNPSATIIPSPSCLLTPVPSDQVRRVSINVGVAFVSTDRTNLTYTAPGKEPRKITLKILEPSVWWRPIATLPSVEVGAGFGIMWFAGDPAGSFPAFTRGAIEPIRIDIKLSLFSDLAGKHQTWMEALSVRWGLFVIPAGFVAEDFGAIPGSFRNVKDVQQNATLFFELDPILRHRRGAR